jgi:hypothetical protein
VTAVKKLVCGIFLKTHFRYGGQYDMKFVPNSNGPGLIPVVGPCKNGSELCFQKLAGSDKLNECQFLMNIPQIKLIQTLYCIILVLIVVFRVVHCLRYLINTTFPVVCSYSLPHSGRSVIFGG